MKKQTSALLVLAVAASAHAAGQVRITEWMYNPASGAGEFIELTNIGDMSIDVSGWSYDDDSRIPGSFMFGPVGLLAPGESLVLTESTEADFRARWSLAPTVKVLGGVTNNLGRNDEINIYDAMNALVDRLTYGDQNFPGSIRTQGRSGNPLDGALGANNPFLWVLASVGDIYGSYAASTGDIGNPGFFIPSPAAGIVCMTALIGLRRRR